MGILLLVMTMGALSAVGWIFEAKPGVAKLRRLQAPMNTNIFSTFTESIRYIADFIIALISFWPFVLDVAITCALIGMFGIGGSIAGWLTALTISNVITAYILYESRKRGIA